MAVGAQDFLKRAFRKKKLQFPFSSYPAVVSSVRLHPNKLVAPYSSALPAASFNLLIESASVRVLCCSPIFLPEALPIKANDYAGCLCDVARRKGRYSISYSNRSASVGFTVDA